MVQVMPASQAAQQLASYIPLVVTLISGGLAGAIVTLFFTRRRQRIDCTLKVIDTYFDLYHEIGDCRQLLEAVPFPDTPANRNRVRKLGDWFSIVARMSREKIIVRKLLLDKFGFRSQIELFRTLVSGSDLFHPFLDGPWLQLRDFH